MVDSQSLEVDKNSNPCGQLSWPQLCGVSRVSGHAAKVRHQTVIALNAFFTSFHFLSCLEPSSITVEALKNIKQAAKENHMQS